MPTIEYERNGEIASIERDEYTFTDFGTVSAWNEGRNGPEEMIKLPLSRVVTISDAERGVPTAR